MTRRRGYAVVGLVAAVLMLLAAHGCGQSEPPPWSPSMSTNGHPVDPCGYVRTHIEYGDDLYEHFLHWTPDVSHLVFDIDDTIWTLDLEEARLMEVVDVDPDYEPGDEASYMYRFKFGFHADVSPDGSEIVYTTCEHRHDGYGLSAVKPDGTGKRRLTEDGYFYHYPVWSPDGERVAFVGQRVFADPTWSHPQVDTYRVVYLSRQDRVRLSILSVKSGAGRIFDTLLRRGGVRELEATSHLALAPPVWSPDGDHLAFIANEGERREYRYRGRRAYRYTRVLHAVRADGSRLARIGETTALPTWSPDGDELAYATVDGDVPALYAVRPDGTGRRLIWSGGADDGFAPISEVLWSPDGSEILFFTNEPYLVRPDGGGLRRLGIPRHVPDARAAWSPDGSRIAIHYPYQQIVTVSRDGTEALVHAEADIDPKKKLPPRERSEPYPRAGFRALDPPLAIALPYRPACSSAVPDPDANPGLVRDCETLLRIRTALFGLGPAGTGRQFEYGATGSAWTEDMPIGTWTAVSVGGDPPRVRELLLGGEARGAIPPDIARLEMLEVLGINGLTGPIPPELGRLTNLKELYIGDNRLRGGIPPELGALKNLAILYIARNSLSGGIPPELGALTNLTYLDLSENYGLSGDIPAELGALTRLETLNLAGVVACIPVELPALWVKASGLERCKPKGEDGS